MELPSEIRSKISEYIPGNKHCARSLNLSVADLIDQIEDMDLNPIDFIWNAIDEERRDRQKVKEAGSTPVGQLWLLLRGSSWTAQLKDLRDLYLETGLSLPSSVGNISIQEMLNYPGGRRYRVSGGKATFGELKRLSGLKEHGTLYVTQIDYVI